MTGSTPTNKTGQCGSDDASNRSELRLPVLETDHRPRGHIRASKNGRRRAVVLLIVQVLMIAHLVQWWITGRTTTPVEPSESMEFVKSGVVNVGLIFFALALLATIVLGRWFCGWGCHLVMLQDLCGWCMKKLGVRPKPFRSRLLVYVPFLLALYMFVWPAVFRWGVVPLDASLEAQLGADHWLVESVRGLFGIGGIELPRRQLPPWAVSWHLTTEGFWDTFAGPLVAIPFLLVCGFATVYFLGSKGFCTYGCPYGGFFAPLDEFAPGRIRVTDACEHCGHCTAVCTSNVRVHEEVREYGMVVDPGCMKCLDCVSVCPNDALHFGFGRPAVRKGEARTRPPRPLFDLSWPEEIAFAGVFALSFFSVRGVYGVVPMLFAAGVAGCVTFLAWKLWQLIRRDSVSVLRTRLKYKGSMQRHGWLWAGGASLALLLVVHSGVVKAIRSVGDAHDRKVTIPAAIVFSPDAPPLPPEMLDHLDQALGCYDVASFVGSGGIGLLPTWQTDLDLRRAWLHAAARRLDEAERLLEEAIRRDGISERLSRNVALVRRAQGTPRSALAWYAAALREHRDYHAMLGEYVSWAAAEGLGEEAATICRERLARWPDDALTALWLSRLRLDAGALDEGVALGRRAVQLAPDSVDALTTLARALALAELPDEAVATMQRAVDLSPDSASVQLGMATLLESIGRLEDARPFAERARELRATHSHTAQH
ncbi:MAG: 4Fe-4S binding protein [Planctomycetota bacterium]|jgi:polyferredoxin/Flp pilus assembly protein TadD